MMFSYFYYTLIRKKDFTMSEKRKEISSSTICSGLTGYILTERELPELASIGIRNCGDTNQTAPYEMIRLAGEEKQHVTLWFVRTENLIFESGCQVFHVEPYALVVQNSAFNRRAVVNEGMFSSLHFYLPGLSLEPGVYPASCLNELAQVMSMLHRECIEYSGPSVRKRLLVELLDSYLKKELTRPSSNELLQKAMELVEKQIGHPWTTRMLAEKLHVSPSLLYQKAAAFKRGSPGQMIAAIKFQRADYLLRYTNMSLTEIALQIGYSSAFAFSKAYLKHCGKRPGAARKE